MGNILLAVHIPGDRYDYVGMGRDGQTINLVLYNVLTVPQEKVKKTMNLYDGDYCEAANHLYQKTQQNKLETTLTIPCEASRIVHSLK